MRLFSNNVKKMKVRNVLSLILFIAYLGAVAYCCFGYFSDLPDVGSETFLGIPMDKVVHFIMFFPFPILCHLVFSGRARKRPYGTLISAGCVFLAGCAIAAATEIGQYYTEYRSCDVKDFIADCLALTLSSLVIFGIETLIAKKRKQI